MKKFDELIENTYRPEEILRKQQKAGFIKLIDHARVNVLYYRDILRDIEIRSLDDISSIPFLTKKAIHDNIEDLKAVNCPRERFIPNSTGGSTGEKLDFYSDTNQILASLLLRSNSWTGWEMGEKRCSSGGRTTTYQERKVLSTN